MPRPARISVYNSSSRDIALKCAETRDVVVIPAYSTRKVHASYLVNKPASIIETHKLNPEEPQPEAVAPEPVPEQPIVQSTPKPNPLKAIDDPN
jgi:hypothetical protein